MKKKLTPILTGTLVCWLIFAHLQSQQKDQLQPYEQLFRKAEALFSGIATDSTDAVALNYYTQIKTKLQPNLSNAEMLYRCYERSGILKQGLHYPSKHILQDFYTGLQIHKTFQLKDSVLFKLLLSAGNEHYYNGLFDSSVYYFSWAEKIIDRYPKAGFAGDLYNSLGALYSEAGNYMQSGIYFTKALELTRQNHPELEQAFFAMSANIASAVRASGYSDSALRLYKKLVDAANPSANIINNISEIYLASGQPDSALHYLQLVKAAPGTVSITIHNAIARAYMFKGDTAQAAQFLQLATDWYTSNMPNVKNNSYAANQKNWGDLKMMESNPQAALPHYQQAIIQYHFKFNDTDVFKTPGNFIGDFASYNLFNALIAKAACLSVIYNSIKGEQYFRATINTYDSAFALADYIKKTIDNDEARLFIADKVFNAYNKAVQFLMMATGNPDEHAIVHALEWISKSRATSLAINLKENKVKQYAGLPDSLLQKEKNIKISISRLKLQLQQSSDTAAQAAVVSAINTASLELQAVDNQFKKYPNYYNQQFAADSIDIPGIQQRILNRRTAIVCYYKIAEKLYAYVIKQHAIVHHTINADSMLNQQLDAFIHALTINDVGKTYNASTALFLYTKLIQPLTADLKGITSLVMIPDQELINVPFEALQPSNNRYLVEDYAITYQYALPFLQKSKISFDEQNAIAFAPFAAANNNTNLSVLPSSVSEIAHFSKAAQFINGAATKNKFVSTAAKASVIHLATHAAVNFQEPENSYIAFYEKDRVDSSYKIFAHELYNLQLPNTKFVFLSACETGSGKVSRSEGALSISRAFAYAGCPNIVTSLWKAEDKTTAYISAHFYKYVNKGYSYATALQRAKTDLLKDETMSQFHPPAYWSHLIFIGEVQEETSSIGWWWIALGAVVMAASALFLYRKIAPNLKH